MNEFYLYDKDLSWSAKGLLYFMILNIEEYLFDAKILSELSADSFKEVSEALKELEKSGYVKYKNLTETSLLLPPVQGLYTIYKKQRKKDKKKCVKVKIKV